MRYILGLVSIASLAACATSVPDSGAAPQTQARSTTPTGAPLSTMIEGGTVSSQPIDGSATQTSPGISDEQDFGAVAGRESIESDAERIQGYQAAYTQVEPEAVPERPSGSSVSVVQFALSTTNSVGQAIYSRSALSGSARAERNCARFTSADFAQIAFLEAGGPKRDAQGLDPDGDGFACKWDPAPFRTAKSGAVGDPAAQESGVSKSDLEALGITTDGASVVSEPAPVPAPVPAPLPGEALNISSE